MAGLEGYLGEIVSSRSRLDNSLAAYTVIDSEITRLLTEYVKRVLKLHSCHFETVVRGRNGGGIFTEIDQVEGLLKKDVLSVGTLNVSSELSPISTIFNPGPAANNVPGLMRIISPAFGHVSLRMSLSDPS